jgi:N-acetylglutamate synthase-like GNAT family acetyltransferase
MIGTPVLTSVTSIAARPDAAGQVARWIEDEWGRLPIHDYLTAFERDEDWAATFPYVLIAEQAGAVVGTASLLYGDMETRPELGPWLGCVYVRPECRGQGIGSRLTEKVERLAESLGIRTLYLFTADQEAFYRRLGWSTVEETEYEDERVAVMRKVVSRARFSWRVFDVEDLLPTGWQQELLDLAEREASHRILRPRSVTSREGDPDLRLPVITVSGRVLREDTPWLASLYDGWFREFAATCSSEVVTTAVDDRYGANLNVQRGCDMRYECHVDSNPIEGLLYVTDHPKGSGGELVAANHPGATSIEEVDEDCSVLHPEAGRLVFFDAREFAHYVRPLRRDDAIRAVVAMNFYTPSSPESARPEDLNDHLFGEVAELGTAGETGAGRMVES